MKLFFILFFSLALFVDADTITDMQTEQRVALVIGNNNYSGVVLNPLRNPKNDAQAIKELLESRGFEVIYRTNITKKEFKESIFKFNKKIEQGGVGLFYYAGHGMEVENKNYLVPIDAKLQKKMDIEFESIELNYIIKGMQESHNRLNIIILDACRTNPFFDGRGSKGGLAEVRPIGLFVSYATGAGKIAQDNRSEENGLFTKYLIHYMKQPLTLQEVFRKTREKVYEESSKEQFPAIYDQIVNGRFYFTLPNKSTILSSKEDTSNYSTLDIETTPKNAIVELVGFSQRYYKGIKLRNGRYKIKVSKYGYIAKDLEVDLNSNTKLSVVLNKEKIVYKEVPTHNHGSLFEQAVSSKSDLDREVNYIRESLKKEILNLDYTVGKATVTSNSDGTYDVTVPIDWKMNENNIKNIFSKNLKISQVASTLFIEDQIKKNSLILFIGNQFILKKLDKNKFYLEISLYRNKKINISLSFYSMGDDGYAMRLKGNPVIIFHKINEFELKKVLKIKSKIKYQTVYEKNSIGGSLDDLYKINREKNKHIIQPQ